MQSDTVNGVNKEESPFRQFRQYFAWRNQAGIRREISHDAYILFITLVVMMAIGFGLAIASAILPTMEPIANALERIATIFVLFVLGAMWGVLMVTRLFGQLAKEHGLRLSFQPTRAKHWLHAFYLAPRNENISSRQDALTDTDRDNKFVWQHKFQMAGCVSIFYIIFVALNTAQIDTKIVGIVSFATIVLGVAIWDWVHHREMKGSTK